MSDADAATPSTDPTLAIAELQLAILAEVVQMSLAVSRGYAAASLAAANAVEVILADEFWQPETGRAGALAGAREAADSFQKVTRSLRLSMKLQMETAETVRDLRAGIVPQRKAASPFDLKDAGGTPACPETLVRRRPAGSCDAADNPDLDRLETDLERLVEFDRPNGPARASFREKVDEICLDIGIAPDWKAWRIGRPPKFQPLAPRPPGWSECRPPGAQAILEANAEPALDDRSTARIDPVGRPDCGGEIVLTKR